MHKTTCTRSGCSYAAPAGEECNFHRTGYIERFIVPELGPCHIWQGKAHKDYGYLSLPGGIGTITAHRAAYAAATGEDITGVLVRHRCDVKLCIRREHLLAGTHQDNMADGVARERFLAGEAVHFAVLTEKQVVEIRERFAAGGVTHLELAREYRVGKDTVRSVVIGKTWKRAPGPITVPDPKQPRMRPGRDCGSKHYIAKLTEDDVRAIRSKRVAGASYKELMQEYGLSSQGTISAILSRHTWKHVL